MSITSGYTPGWYAVSTNTGYSGLVLHHGQGGINLGSRYGTVTQAQQVGSSGQPLYQILSSSGPQIEKALTSVGATGAQLRTFMQQATAAAGKQQGHAEGGIGGFLTGLVGATPFVPGRQTTQLLIGGGGQPSASSGRYAVPTVSSGNVGSASGPAGTASDAIASAAGSIGSITDFLAWIAWLFHPLNLLRAVEFIAGLNLAGAGVYLLAKGGGLGGGGTTIRRVVSLTPAGRTIRMAQGRRMGRHEGQREAARMTARQAETREAREASAVEREQINRNARETVRQGE